MIKTKRLFKICMLFLLCIHVINAQQDSVRHTVARGETIMQIAKKYNVTPYDIQQANSDTLESLDDIKEHQVLIIPQSKIQTPQLTSASDSIRSSLTNTTNISYTVKKGETKYGLSKRFGMSIPELEASNPHIIPGLNEGHVLKVNSPTDADSDPIQNTTKPQTSYEGYKTHLVLRGETLWGISHSNGLTVEQLVAENRDVLRGILQEGQTLKIPQVRQEDSPYDTYLVKYGDTKYGLAKKYETTIAAMERLNPHIVRMLQAGHTIRIPSDAIENEGNVAVVENQAQVQQEDSKNDEVESNNIPNELPEEDTTPEDASVTQVDTALVKESVIESPIKNNDTLSSSSEDYISYEIKPKETLFGLSKKAGMSIAEFVVLNPQLKESVQIGMIIKMPREDNATLNEDSNTEAVSTSTTSRYADLLKTMNSSSSKTVMFFLPFSEADLDTELELMTTSKNLDDFEKTHLEFYSGAKIAIDSVKNLGYNVSSSILEVNTTKRNSKLTSLLNDRALLTGDAIIIPFYDDVYEEVASTVAETGIPVIAASTISPYENLSNLYGAFPSINQQRTKMLDYLVSKQGNIVVVSDVNRPESNDFIKGYIPNAKFITLKKNGTFSEDELISQFVKDKMNYVILDSERNSVFLNVTNTLLSELNRYSIQLAVLEEGIIPDTGDVSVKRYRILKMLFPSLTPLDMSLKSADLNRTYEKLYEIKPSENAILGFDITFDALLRLFQDYTFETSIQKDITIQSKYTFDYEQIKSGSYSNEGIYLLQYDTNSNLQEAD